MKSYTLLPMRSSVYLAPVGTEAIGEAQTQLGRPKGTACDQIVQLAASIHPIILRQTATPTKPIIANAKALTA